MPMHHLCFVSFTWDCLISSAWQSLVALSAFQWSKLDLGIDLTIHPTNWPEVNKPIALLCVWHFVSKILPQRDFFLTLCYQKQEGALEVGFPQLQGNYQIWCNTNKSWVQELKPLLPTVLDEALQLYIWHPSGQTLIFAPFYVLFLLNSLAHLAHCFLLPLKLASVICQDSP